MKKYLLLLSLVCFQMFAQTVEYNGTRIFKGTLRVADAATFDFKGTEIDSIVVSGDSLYFYVGGDIYKSLQEEYDPVYSGSVASEISAQDTNDYRNAVDSLHYHANKSVIDNISAADTTRYGLCKLNANISKSGNLNSVTSTVTLTAYVNTEGVTYDWDGGSGTDKEYIVTVAGNYELIVSKAGCIDDTAYMFVPMANFDDDYNIVFDADRGLTKVNDTVRYTGNFVIDGINIGAIAPLKAYGNVPDTYPAFLFDVYGNNVANMNRIALDSIGFEYESYPDTGSWTDNYLVTKDWTLDKIEENNTLTESDPIYAADSANKISKTSSLSSGQITIATGSNSIEGKDSLKWENGGLVIKTDAANNDTALRVESYLLGTYLNSIIITPSSIIDKTGSGFFVKRNSQVRFLTDDTYTRLYSPGGETEHGILLGATTCNFNRNVTIDGTSTLGNASTDITTVNGKLIAVDSSDIKTSMTTWHRNDSINTPTADTWIDIKLDTMIASLTTYGFTTTDSINFVSNTNGIFEANGIFNQHWYGTTAPFTSYIRTLKNSSEIKEAKSRISLLYPIGNEEFQHNINGRINIVPGDTLKFQYYISSTDLDFDCPNAVFDDEPVIMINIKKVSK